MWRNLKKNKWTGLLLFIGLIWWQFHVFYPEVIYNDSYIYNRLADEGDLVGSFDNIVFQKEKTKAIKGSLVLKKWSSSIRYSVFGNVSDFHEKTIQDVANKIKSLTGLGVRKLGNSDPEMANFRIHISTRDKLKYTANEDVLNSGHAFEKAWCLSVTRINENGRITFAKNFIPIDIEDEEATSCILEEFAHAFGSGHTSLYLPSVFGRSGSPQQLSINDKIMVRTLYDKRLKPGMTRDEAMPIVRKIIPELVAAVKERGEEALYQ